jgi:SPP1 family predicted phage head-tail adaptor
MIEPGRLKNKVIIQNVTEVVNSLGEATRSYSEFARVWASVEGVSSKESLGPTGKVDFSITHRVRMRYVDGLDNTMRIIYRGRTLEIVGLLEHANRTEHELLCAELFR